MVGYVIRIKASVEKDIAALPRDLTVRILQGIEDLSEAPLPFGVRRLSGAENLYRIRGGLSDHICRAPRGAGDHHPLRPPPSHCMPWIVRSDCRLTEKDPRLRCPAGEKIHRSRPSPGRDVPGQPATDWLSGDHHQLMAWDYPCTAMAQKIESGPYLEKRRCWY